MSKIVKRKISVKIANTRDSSSNRLSVFQRLGNKKVNHPASVDPAGNRVPAILASSPEKSSSKHKSTTKVGSSHISTRPSSTSYGTMKHHSSKTGSSSHHHRLDDADPASLEQKRAELKKELELQLKMESAARKSKAAVSSSGPGGNRAEANRKRKPPARRSTSSSSSSSSGSDSSSDSSSSDSGKGKARRSGQANKARKNVKLKRHQSSSSSDGDEPRRKAKSGTSLSAAAKAKRVCHKKLDASGKVKLHHSKKTIEKTHSVVQRKRSVSPSQIVVRKHQRPTSPSGIKPSTTKAAAKAYPDPAILKHHRHKETALPPLIGGGGGGVGSSHHRADKEREFQMREREQREREHLRARERIRSRSPGKLIRMKSRSPVVVKRVSRSRDLKQRSPPPGSLRRPPSKPRSGLLAAVRKADRTPERIIIKKDVSGKRHETSREQEHRRERDREREAAVREKERLELMREQERSRERERLERDRIRVKVVDPREREVDQRTKTERLLPRPAERAMALAAARDRSREKSEDRGGLLDHRPRSLSHTRSGRDPSRGVDRLDVYADRGYERVDDRYEMHRRMDKERSSAGQIRDDRSERGGGGGIDREYLVVRRREDSRGRIIEESLVLDPYLQREQIRGGPLSERDRSMDRERERDPRSLYLSDRDRERMHGELGRYEEHLGRGPMDDRRLDRGGGSDRGHDYGRPLSRGGYIEDARGLATHRTVLDGPHRDRSVHERDGWHRDMDGGPIRLDDRGSGHHMYDRHSGRGDWERNEMPPIRQPSAGRGENSSYSVDGGRRDGSAMQEWSSGGDRQWDDRNMSRRHGADRGHGVERGSDLERGSGPERAGGHHEDRGNWSHQERDVDKWDVPEEYGPNEYHRGSMSDKVHHDVDNGNHNMVQGSRGGPGNRRWPNWRNSRGGSRGGGGGGGAIGNAHHGGGEGSTNLFRRQNTMHNSQEGFQEHQGESHFRRHNPGQGGSHPHASGEYQPTHHHGHNAFSNSIVRPLLSLPPLKPPIMDDIVPSLISPSIALLKVAPAAVLNPSVVSAPPTDAAKEESVPAVDVVTSAPSAPAKTEEDTDVVKESVAIPDVPVAPEAELPKETTVEDDDPDDVEGDALSEISDDADEILNRQEEEAAAAALKAAAAQSAPLISQKPALLPTPPFKVGEYPRLLIHPPYAPVNLMGQPFDDQHMHHMHQTHHHNHIKPMMVSAVGADLLNDAKDDDIDLDFEEISDGELEEEARIRGLGDALGVDWASLVEESKAKAIGQQVGSSASAKQRWQPHRILLDVGVSFRMAGKEFASNVLNAAHRKLKADEAEARRLEAEKEQQQKSEEAAEFTIKKEIPDADDEMAEQPDEPASATGIKTAPDAEHSEESDAELLIHPIACVQVASRVNAETRKNLVFGMTGPYSRALSSHRDIQMRRQLCGLSVKRCAPVGAATTGGGADYAVIARQLFEKALGKVN